jgi:hypothetical protein
LRTPAFQPANVEYWPIERLKPYQVKAFRLMVNRSVSWADCDLDALAMEFGELKALVFDLTLTGFGFAGDRRLHTSIKFSRR